MIHCGNETEVRCESGNVEVSEYGISMEGSQNGDTGHKAESGKLRSLCCGLGESTEGLKA